nr:hypothetical protein [Hankyongella ginsenosidimutans]
MKIFASSVALLAAGWAGEASALALQASQVYNAQSATTSEIVAFEADTQRIYVAAGPVVEVRNAVNGALITTLTPPAGFGGVNSVAVKNGRLAVAADAATRTDPGGVFFYNTGNLAASPSIVQVGAVPDNVVFTPDGSRLLVANEGEPNSYGQVNSVNPEGSISVIDVATLAEQKATFTNFTAQGLRDAGVRIYGLVPLRPRIWSRNISRSRRMARRLMSPCRKTTRLPSSTSSARHPPFRALFRLASRTMGWPAMVLMRRTRTATGKFRPTPTFAAFTRRTALLRSRRTAACC